MKRKQNPNFKITLIITGLIFILLLMTMVISNAFIFFFVNRGLISNKPTDSLFPFLVQTSFISIITGTGLSFFMSHHPLRPLHTLIQAIHEVSEGNFDVKIHFEHPKEFQELSECFNQMTRELSNIEILRFDFINNFSHEFKTPIVSILGFAKILKADNNLTLKQRQEYLDIIISESKRLSDLSATVLNLSKVESLTLLTDKTKYSLSEQIRESILLLERKWGAKQIDFRIEMEEIEIVGSKSLLKQVWVNLLDNAIKFSSIGDTIQIMLSKSADTITFLIRDNGIGMEEKTIETIFDKFYQGDLSHHTEGNGLGLPLVKKIVNLHKGTISVKSRLNRGSIFIITLPFS